MEMDLIFNPVGLTGHMSQLLSMESKRWPAWRDSNQCKMFQNFCSYKENSVLKLSQEKSVLDSLVLILVDQ